MEHHQFFVLGEADVQFDSVSSQFQRFLEGRDGVLRGIGDIAPVGDD
jgi:hypothetical protein